MTLYNFHLVESIFRLLRIASVVIVLGVIVKLVIITRIKPRMYVRRSTMYKKVYFISQNWRREKSTVACGSS